MIYIYQIKNNLHLYLHLYFSGTAPFSSYFSDTDLHGFTRI